MIFLYGLFNVRNENEKTLAATFAVEARRSLAGVKNWH